MYFIMNFPLLGPIVLVWQYPFFQRAHTVFHNIVVVLVNCHIMLVGPNTIQAPVFIYMLHLV